MWTGVRGRAAPGPACTRGAGRAREGRDMPEELSEKQRAILEFLETFIAEHDYPPSIRDIQSGCGISSTSVVDYNLKRLEERGFIRRDREVSRAIELLDAGGRGGRTAGGAGARG